MKALIKPAMFICCVVMLVCGAHAQGYTLETDPMPPDWYSSGFGRSKVYVGQTFRLPLGPDIRANSITVFFGRQVRGGPFRLLITDVDNVTGFHPTTVLFESERVWVPSSRYIQPVEIELGELHLLPEHDYAWILDYFSVGSPSFYTDMSVGLGSYPDGFGFNYHSGPFYPTGTRQDHFESNHWFISTGDNAFQLVLSPPNDPPVADAGGPYMGKATSWLSGPVNLDGLDSYDPENGALTYEWDLDHSVDSNGDGNPSNDLDLATATAIVDFPIGETEISLVVVDDQGQASDPDITTVTISYADVEIDIKPDSYPNCINMRSHGVTPVAFLTDESFDATMIDPMTVTWRGADFSECLVRLRGKKHAKPLTSIEDVDGDGDLDLLVKIDTEKLCGDENGKLIGSRNIAYRWPYSNWGPDIVGPIPLEEWSVTLQVHAYTNYSKWGAFEFHGTPSDVGVEKFAYSASGADLLSNGIDDEILSLGEFYTTGFDPGNDALWHYESSFLGGMEGSINGIDLAGYEIEMVSFTPTLIAEEATRWKLDGRFSFYGTVIPELSSEIPGLIDTICELGAMTYDGYVVCGSDTMRIVP